MSFIQASVLKYLFFSLSVAFRLCVATFSWGWKRKYWTQSGKFWSHWLTNDKEGMHDSHQLKDCTYSNASLDIPLHTYFHFISHFYSAYLIKEQDSEVSQRYFSIRFWVRTCPVLVLVLFSFFSSWLSTQCKCSIRTVTSLLYVLFQPQTTALYKD